MKNTTAKKVIAMIIMTVMCITLFSFTASAVELNTKGSITLHVADYVSGEPIDSLTFRLYFFAAAYEKENGLGYDYVIPYDDCHMDINDLEDSYLPIHLAHYAETHSLPYTEKTTDINGNAVFAELDAGLYLAVFSESGNDYFVPSPFVINVPHFDRENNNWKFDVIAKPKMLSYLWADTDSPTYISVKKVWETEKIVPESVSVSLLRDYKEVAKVTLNESNNWSYRWDNLSKKHSWSVVESEVPDGYKVSYTVSENTVTIINTYDSSSLQETTTSPEPDVSTTKPSVTSPEEITKPEELIDTGQLNWPVPIFTIAGLLLFSAGWILFNSGKKDEETV